MQTNFLAAGSSLGHLSIKSFSDWTCHLGSKIRQEYGAGGGGGLTLFRPGVFRDPPNIKFPQRFLSITFRAFEIIL